MPDDSTVNTKVGSLAAKPDTTHTHTRHGEGEAEELPYPSLHIFDVFAHAASAYTFSKVSSSAFTQ